MILATCQCQILCCIENITMTARTLHALVVGEMQGKPPFNLLRFTLLRRCRVTNQKPGWPGEWWFTMEEKTPLTLSCAHGNSCEGG